MYNKTYDRLPEFKENIGKKCRVTDTVVAGVVGKEGTIVNVSGDDREGYRYQVSFNPRVGALDHIENLYPPVYCVELL
jgi:hypothetical protein